MSNDVSIDGCVPSDLVQVIYVALGQNEPSQGTYLFLSVDGEVKQFADSDSLVGHRITLLDVKSQKKFSMVIYPGMMKLSKISENP